jgi:hypothetical protein
MMVITRRHWRIIWDVFPFWAEGDGTALPGNVGLVMADSNFSKLSGEEREQQSQWYVTQPEKFERTAAIDFIIVCLHEPPFTNSRVIPPNQEAGRTFADPFLSGHSHSYERSQAKGKFFIVSGGETEQTTRFISIPESSAYTTCFQAPNFGFSTSAKSNAARMP